MKKTAMLLVFSALIVSCVVIAQPVSALENSWMQRPPMLEPAGMAVAVDGKIYAISAITQEYDPVALTWTKKASTPNPASGGIVVYQNELDVIGGLSKQV